MDPDLNKNGIGSTDSANSSKDWRIWIPLFTSVLQAETEFFLFCGLVATVSLEPCTEHSVNGAITYLSHALRTSHSHMFKGIGCLYWL